MTGAYNYLLGGDLNTEIDTRNNYWGGGGLEGDLKKLHHGYDFMGELRIKPFGLPSMMFSISSGRIYGKVNNKFLDKFTETDYDSGPTVYECDSGIWDIEAAAIPIMLTAYYTHSLSPKLSLYGGGGMGYYLAKLFQKETEACVEVTKEKWENIQKGWSVEPQDIWDDYLSSRGVGLHTKCGIEYAVTERLTITLGIEARYAKIKGFKGKEKHIDIYGTEREEEEYDVMLYYVEEDVGDGNFQPFTWACEEKPEPDQWTRNIREAIVDFSGVCVRMGVRFYIF